MNQQTQKAEDEQQRVNELHHQCQNNNATNEIFFKKLRIEDLAALPKDSLRNGKGNQSPSKVDTPPLYDGESLNVNQLFQDIFQRWNKESIPKDAQLALEEIEMRAHEFTDKEKSSAPEEIF